MAAISAGKAAGDLAALDARMPRKKTTVPAPPKKMELVQMYQMVKAAESQPAVEPKKVEVAGPCKTRQQLNAQRQNARRAKEKAHQRGPKLPSEPKPKVAPAATPGRVLDAVAEVWARKKAKLAAASLATAT